MIIFMKNKIENASVKVKCKAMQVKTILAEKSGEAYLDLVIIS